MDLISIKVFVSCFFALWAIIAVINLTCGVVTTLLDVRKHPDEYKEPTFVVFTIAAIFLVTVTGPVGTAFFISMKADIFKTIDDEIDELDEDELFYRQENSCNQMTTI